MMPFSPSNPFKTVFKPFGSNGVEQIVFDFLAKFGTPESAPIATPHVCDTGGPLAVVQTDGQMSVADGVLTIPAQATPAWGDLGLYSQPSYARSVGRIVVWGLTHAAGGGQASVGVGPASVILHSSHAGIVNLGSAQRIYDGANVFAFTGQDSYTPDSGERLLSVILRASGEFLLDRDFLIYTGKYRTLNPVYPRIAQYSTPMTVEFGATAQLPEPFDTDTGWATLVQASPTPDTLYDTGTDNPYFVFSWTPQADETLELVYRYYDADNYMLLRWIQATGVCTVVEIYAGVEIVRGTLTSAPTAGTTYDISLRAMMDRHTAWITRSAANVGIINATATAAFMHSRQCKINMAITNLTVWPVELSGNALSVYNKRTNPYLVGGRVRQTINVPDGANIATYVAQLRGGDILSLATNGTYANIPLTSLPRGYPGYPTTVLGNGATISAVVTGGAVGIQLADTSYIAIYNVIVADCLTNMLLTRVRHATISNCYSSINIPAAPPSAYDNYKLDSCVDVYFSSCEAGPSIASPDSMDGFELYGSCRDITFDTCIAHGCLNGFEAWIPPRPAWQNANILVVNCNSYDNRGAGYSNEGGAQGLNSGMIVRDSTASGNGTFDAQGIDGATLRLQNCPGFTTGGSVIVDY